LNKSSEIINSVYYNSVNTSNTFKPDESYLVLLKNNRNCIECFRVINRFVKEIKDSLDVKFIVLSQIDSSTLERKRNLINNKELLPDFTEYCFQYFDSDKKSIAEILKTNYTPEVIIIKNGIVNYFRYDLLFNYRSLSLSEKTKQDLINLLK
jgi:hypothetical protein